MLQSSEHKIIALIPARGGSKGVPKKNIFLVRDKPLINYTIEAIIQSQVADEIYVTSDCDSIISVCKKFMSVRCVKRKEHLALDTTTTDSVVMDFIEFIGNGKPTQLTSILLLQPTSPLRNFIHIREATQMYLKDMPDLLMSVFTPAINPYKSLYLHTDGYIYPIVGKEAPFMSRQSLPKVYHPNGAIYLFSVKNFMQEGCIPRKNILPFEMSIDVSIDIDTMQDIYKTEAILDARGLYETVFDD